MRTPVLPMLVCLVDPGEATTQACQLQEEALEGPIRLWASEVLRHETGYPTRAPRREGAETFENLFDGEVGPHRGRTHVRNACQGRWVAGSQCTVDVGGQGMLFLGQDAGSLAEGPVPDGAEGCTASAVGQAPRRRLCCAVAPSRGWLAGKVLPDEGSLLASGPPGQAPGNNGHGRLQ